MICPMCGAETRVVDSRPASDSGRADYSVAAQPGYAIRRRRVCTQCKATFTTMERYWGKTRTRKDKA